MLAGQEGDAYERAPDGLLIHLVSFQKNSELKQNISLSLVLAGCY